MLTIKKFAGDYFVYRRNAIAASHEMYSGSSAVGALHCALAQATDDEEFGIEAAVRRELCEALRELLSGAEAERAEPPTRESVVSYLKAQRDVEASRWETLIEVVERGE